MGRGIDNSLPVMILVMGVFQCSHEEQVAGAIKRMKELFPGAELVFDATTSDGLRYTNKYVKKTGNKFAAMYFAVDDAHAFCERFRSLRFSPPYEFRSSAAHSTEKIVP